MLAVRRFLIRCAAVACAVFLLLLAAPAQSGQRGPDDDRTTFKVSVDVVNVFFNAKDKRGALVPNLTKTDFELYEDGQRQVIKYFSSDSNQPLTLGLLIDSSGSQQRVLPMEQEVGSQFLKEVLGPKDLGFVISFDVNVDLLQDFTASSRELRDALYRARINTGGGGGSIGGLGGGPFPTTRTRGTLLYDAIFLAADEKLATEVGRKAMIILTDGVDMGSQTGIRQAIEAAQKADAICYVLLIADRNFVQFGDGEGRMKELAEQTGGRMIRVGNKFERLKEAFDQIAQELRTQYSIGYTPTNPKRDGTFRRIEIRAKELKIQARRGYYAGAQ